MAWLAAVSYGGSEAGVGAHFRGNWASVSCTTSTKDYPRDGWLPHVHVSIHDHHGSLPLANANSIGQFKFEVG